MVVFHNNKILEAAKKTKTKKHSLLSCNFSSQNEHWACSHFGFLIIININVINFCHLSASVHQENLARSLRVNNKSH